MISTGVKLGKSCGAVSRSGNSRSALTLHLTIVGTIVTIMTMLGMDERGRRPTLPHGKALLVVGPALSQLAEDCIYALRQVVARARRLHAQGSAGRVCRPVGLGVNAKDLPTGRFSPLMRPTSIPHAGSEM